MHQVILHPRLDPGLHQFARQGEEKHFDHGLIHVPRIFAEDGRTIPVTVLDVSDNRVSQIKTIDTDGYAAVQIAYGKRRASRITKPVRFYGYSNYGAFIKRAEQVYG